MTINISARSTARAILLALTSITLATAVQAASSASRTGITWFFDRDYPTGQFANGDPWVVGPVTITRITPGDSNPSDSTDIHGTVINPVPDTDGPYFQGWDSRVGGGTTYDRSINAARNLPLRVPAGNSLVSVNSDVNGPGTDKLYINDAAVLTVLASAPAPGSFRPPYAGTDKSIPGNVSQLNWSRFRSLAPVSSTPSLSSYDNAFSQVLLDVIGQWPNSSLKAANAGPNYGRDIAGEVGTAVLLLNLNFSREQKTPLLIKLVQRGIDVYGLAKAGMIWKPNGGHNTGRKMMMVVAGVALNHADMIAWSNGERHLIFQEDMQHFYVNATDVATPRTVSSLQPYTNAMIGMPEWASNPISERAQTGSQWDKAYRFVNGIVHTGIVLGAEIMGLREIWNWEPLFDYIDERYWPKEGVTSTSSLAIPGFHRAMWNTYRKSPGETVPSDPAPTPPPPEEPTPEEPTPDPTPDPEPETPPTNEIDVDNTAPAGIWQNLPVATQAGSFTCSFEMIASKSNMDGVIGLSEGAANNFSDMMVGIRFAPNGQIDARNGDAYQAMNPVAYEGGVRYRVVLSGKLTDHTYSATVQAPDGPVVVIAKNFRFRTEQQNVTSTDNVTLTAVSGVTGLLNLSVEGNTTMPEPQPEPEPEPQPEPEPELDPQPEASAGTSLIRINAGGSSYTDRSGRAWSADKNFVKGRAYTASNAIAGTDDDALYTALRYQTSTSSELAYGISLPNGSYVVRMHFAELIPSLSHSNKRVFDVLVENKIAISRLDVGARVGGNTALAIDVPATVTDGKLDINFGAVTQNPMISAIEILATDPTSTADPEPTPEPEPDPQPEPTPEPDPTPEPTPEPETPPVPTPGKAITRINSGGNKFVDDAGQTWSADTNYVNGLVNGARGSIAATTNDSLYKLERYDNARSSSRLRYGIDVPNGSYLVRLHFAETVGKLFAKNKRVFDVLVENKVAIDNLDIFARVGGNTALVIDVPATVTDGRIDIGFGPEIENPKINAIEILTSN